MGRVGLSLICEEHPPKRLIENGRRAEQCGFDHLSISDHFHPWLGTQGESPFVWNVIGALAMVTEKVEIGTAVTCPTFRYHPAIVAQAAATSAAMLEGRFHLGVGTGEALNESILGKHWPDASTRRDMLEEAVAMIRKLWEGNATTIHGKHYQCENATIFTLPEKLPPIYLAASGPRAAELAGKVGDGFWGTDPDRELIDTFDQAGGAGKPKFAHFHACVAKSNDEAVEIAHKHWANAGLTGELNVILPTPAHFEQACEMVTKDTIAKKVLCSSDAGEHLKMFQKYFEAGYTAVSVHQIGQDHERFFELYEKEVLPALQSAD